MDEGYSLNIAKIRAPRNNWEQQQVKLDGVIYSEHFARAYLGVWSMDQDELTTKIEAFKKGFPASEYKLTLTCWKTTGKEIPI